MATHYTNSSDGESMLEIDSILSFIMSSSTWKYKMLSRLQSTNEFVVIVLTVAVALLVFIQVILRYVFKAPLMRIEELLLFPTIWLYMIGGVVASMKGVVVYDFSDEELAAIKDKIEKEV